MARPPPSSTLFPYTTLFRSGVLNPTYQAVATSQEAVQNQNEPQLRDENAHNDKSEQLRSEERFSRNAETDLVCRLLLEKKNGGARGAGGADVAANVEDSPIR